MIDQTVTVKAKSSKAKNRLANLMQGDSICHVENSIDGRLFLASSNQKNFFWVEPNDPHWEVLD